MEVVSLQVKWKENEEMGKFIDFAYVKEQANFPAVLAHYGIKTKSSGEEVRCSCPFHDDEHPSMSVNLTKKVFTCHADTCGEQGNILEFVDGMEGEIGLREAAEKLADICQIGLAAPRANKASQRRKGSPRAKGREKQPQAKKGRSRPARKAADGRNQEPAPAIQESQKTGQPVFDDEPDATEPLKPLGFELQLDSAHPYGKKRGFSDWQVETFGMGYCSRGTMRNRWCVPIHDPSGQLIAYIGRWPEDELPEDEPRWKLPKDFDKSRVLFNLHRFIETNSSAVVLVEGVFDAIRLAEDGIPAVALLGSSISEAQVTLLKSLPLITAYVMLDGGADEAQDKVVARVSREALTRSVILPKGDDPASVAYEFLQRHMPGMGPLQEVA